MKLNELTKPDLSGNEKYREILSKHGFSEIGYGWFASVYSHPKLNYVLKVFRSEDICYRHFYEIASKNQNNPYFPKFKGQMMRITEEYHAIRMEILSGLVGNDEDKLLVQAIKETLATGQKLPNDIDQKYPKLFDTCELLSKNESSSCHNDVSLNNIMKRGNIPVITDPWS